MILVNFKNYENLTLEFSPKINCFIGDNGVGKTNLLDAVFYLSFCKSYFNSIDTLNILNGETFFSITGIFNKNEENIDDKVQCVQRKNYKKIFKVNGKEYSRLSEHIGLYPVIMVSPSDQNLVNGGSEERRKFIDRIISQFDKNYLNAIINYNKALLQRNTLLKKYSQNKQTFNYSILEVWDEHLIKYGTIIFEKRKKFINNFIGVFNEYYNFISNSKEQVYMDYESQLFTKSFDTLLKESFDKDKAFEYTTTGIHKDDINFKLGNMNLKIFGSQGQQKSYILAMRLAQFDYTYESAGVKPIMLFDDIFDKLDDLRVSQLINIVSREKFGQVFITDTQIYRINKIFQIYNTDHKIFNIHNGKLITNR